MVQKMKEQMVKNLMLNHPHCQRVPKNNPLKWNRVGERETGEGWGDSR